MKQRRLSGIAFAGIFGGIFIALVGRAHGGLYLAAVFTAALVTVVNLAEAVLPRGLSSLFPARRHAVDVPHVVAH